MIANALHILPGPEKVMAEIYRMLKPGGLMIVPTFVHGDSTGAGLRVRMMELAGFKAYHKWTEPEFAAYIKAHNFAVLEQAELGSKLAPLCYLAAKKEE